MLPHMSAPTMEIGTCHSVRSARQRVTVWKWKMTRWARGREGCISNIGLKFEYRNNNETNNINTQEENTTKNTTNSSERQFDPYNILQLHS